MDLPKIDNNYLLDLLNGLVNIPSPSGFTEAGIAFTNEALLEFPSLEITQTHKGALLILWPGQYEDEPRLLTAHVDTLGGMVKEIKSNGRLNISLIGGVPWNTIEGENITIFTLSGKKYRGTVMLTKSSAHTYSKTAIEKIKRNQDSLEIRLDAITEDANQTRGLGIEVGDFIAFDPRLEMINGFIRSRHLDDKAGVACILAAVKAMHQAGMTPVQRTHLLINNYEEVGHGAVGNIPIDVAELVVVDMAAVGKGQNSDEFHATLCLKDTHGPYHPDLSRRLRLLAETFHIPYKVDIFPYYGSDGTNYWEVGGTGKVALIGPGIDASHNYERTHIEALIATTQWIMAYLLN